MRTHPTNWTRAKSGASHPQLVRNVVDSRRVNSNVGLLTVYWKIGFVDVTVWHKEKSGF
jgi:hypothetical protein